jgi:hypothetical protein
MNLVSDSERTKVLLLVHAMSRVDNAWFEDCILIYEPFLI